MRLAITLPLSVAVGLVTGYALFRSPIRTLSQFQASNPDKLTQIAESWTPGLDRDAANRGIVRVLAYKDAPGAIEFARQISNSTIRESAFEQIAQEWFSEDKAAARKWVTTSPEFSSEQKRVLLRQADRAVARNPDLRALVRPSNLDRPSDRAGLLWKFLGSRIYRPRLSVALPGWQARLVPRRERQRPASPNLLSVGPGPWPHHPTAQLPHA